MASRLFVSLADSRKKNVSQLEWLGLIILEDGGGFFLRIDPKSSVSRIVVKWILVWYLPREIECPLP